MSEGTEEAGVGDEGDAQGAHNPAGHAEHFLQRLDRLDDERVELALTMYRDHKSVKLLLDVVAPSRGNGRVAFALGAEEKPPYVIVTSDGHFVTCLAPGMGADGCAVVPYARFIEGVRRVDTMIVRAREWDARKRQVPQGVLARLVSSGPWVPREDVVAILAVQPLIQTTLWNMWVKAPRPVVNAALDLGHIVTPAHRAAVSDQRLRAFWYSLHSIGHLALAATHGPLRDFLAESGVDLSPEKRDHFYPLRVALRTARPFIALQVLNAVARIGRAIVPLLKHQLSHSRGPFWCMEAALGLAAIGARHESLAGEVRKALLSDGDPAAPGHEHRVATRERRERLVALVLDGDRTARETLLVPGHEELVRTYDYFTARGWMNDPRPYRALEDHDPRDLCALGMAELVAGGGPFDHLEQLARALPWAARIEPEEFYLPEREQRIERRPWSRDPVWVSARYLSLMYRDPEPTRVEKKPGRNDPCSCGSGKKFKKCCGG